MKTVKKIASVLLFVVLGLELLRSNSREYELQEISTLISGVSISDTLADVITKSVVTNLDTSQKQRVKVEILKSSVKRETQITLNSFRPLDINSKSKSFYEFGVSYMKNRLNDIDNSYRQSNYQFIDSNFNKIYDFSKSYRDALVLKLSEHGDFKKGITYRMFLRIVGMIAFLFIVYPIPQSKYE